MNSALALPLSQIFSFSTVFIMGLRPRDRLLFVASRFEFFLFFRIFQIFTSSSKLVLSADRAFFAPPFPLPPAHPSVVEDSPTYPAGVCPYFRCVSPCFVGERPPIGLVLSASFSPPFPSLAVCLSPDMFKAAESLAAVFLLLDPAACRSDERCVPAKYLFMHSLTLPHFFPIFPPFPGPKYSHHFSFVLLTRRSLLLARGDDFCSRLSLLRDLLFSINALAYRYDCSRSVFPPGTSFDIAQLPRVSMLLCFFFSSAFPRRTFL